MRETSKKLHIRERVHALGRGIRTPESLHKHLQIAIELEHSTIPPYLCALYSLKDGENLEVAQILRSVVMEEMLHIVLAANVLNAVGGAPDLCHKRFVPDYPTYLPHSDKAFQVSLSRFSKPAMETFLKIEQPKKKKAKPQAHRYETIGQFYAAIEAGLKYLCRKHGEEKVFCGDRARQIWPRQYYGGLGSAIRVTNLETALRALKEIVDQGEGVDEKIWASTRKTRLKLDGGKELAHYFRFNQIVKERRYQPGDTAKSGPRGAPLPVNWKAVYAMRNNPKAGAYAAGSEIREKLNDFNRTYMTLLKVLHDGLNGKPALFVEGVGCMWELKYKAVALMKIPSPLGKGTVGPSFEYHDPMI